MDRIDDQRTQTDTILEFDPNAKALLIQSGCQALLVRRDQPRVRIEQANDP